MEYLVGYVQYGVFGIGCFEWGYWYRVFDMMCLVWGVRGEVVCMV